MFLVLHVLLGALIGLTFDSWLLVFIVAFASHFLLDIIPHWDGNFDNAYFKKHLVPRYKRDFVYTVAFDVMISAVVIYLLYLHFGSGLAVVGGLGAILPDVLKLGYLTNLKNSRAFRKHLLFHSHIQGDVHWIPGLLTQFITLLILLALLFL